MSRLVFVFFFGIFILLFIIFLFYYTDILFEREPITEPPVGPPVGSLVQIDDSSEDLTNLVSQTLIVPNKYNREIETGRKLNLPKNFQISVFAAGLEKPRSMVLDREENIFVTDIEKGAVVLFKDENKDGVADSIIEVDNNLRNPHGIELYYGDLYVAEEHQIIVYRNINSSGAYSSKETLISNLPFGKGHFTRTIHIGPDDKIYLSIGSSCNACEENDDRRAAIVRYGLDGRQEMIIAQGLRNTVGFTFRGNGNNWEILGVENGRDHLGDNLPPEEVNVIEPHPQNTRHYGWPYCYGDKVIDNQFSRPGGFCQNETIAPHYFLPAHTAPLGIALADTGNSLPAGLRDNILVSLHGSWNSSVPVGYRIVRIDDNNSNEPQDFITGWLDNGRVWGRPVDIKVSLTGKIFITDDQSGVIYLVQSSG